MAIWVLRKYTPPAHTGEKSARKKRGVAFLGVVATSGGKRFGDLCSMHFSRDGKGVNPGVDFLKPLLSGIFWVVGHATGVVLTGTLWRCTEA